MIVHNGRANVPLPGLFLQSCSDDLHLTTFEMVYKLNGCKRKVKVFPAAASYVQTPAIVNESNVGRITHKSSLSNLCHAELIGVAAQNLLMRERSVKYCGCCGARSY